jgi:2-octaprenylphenol hydroxylase
MNTISQHDLVIVGGGMVGLSLALTLSSSGLAIALVDPQEKPQSGEALRSRMATTEFDARVSALTPATRQLLADVQVWEALAALRVCAYRDMRVWDADGSGAIHFSADDVHADCLGYIVENSLVSAVLADEVAHRGVTRYQPDAVLSFVQLKDDNGRPLTQLTLQSGQQLQCKLLIGADGANSRIRTEAGFASREWDYGQQALVCTVKTQLPHQYTAWQRFMTTGPLAFLPLMTPGNTDQHYCSIVWSCVPDLAQELLALDDAGFAQRLERAFEARLGRIETVTPRHAFALRQHHATDYVQAGIALVGDAAHTVHPLAGQGVNLGFADVLALAETLQKAVARGEDFASLQVLSRYQRRRQVHNLGMMTVMEGFKRTFASDNLAVRWLRNTGLRAADHSALLKQGLIKKAMGL